MYMNMILFKQMSNGAGEVMTVFSFLAIRFYSVVREITKIEVLRPGKQYPALTHVVPVVQGTLEKGLMEDQQLFLELIILMNSVRVAQFFNQQPNLHLYI